MVTTSDVSDLSSHYDTIFAQILNRYEQLDSETDFPTRPHLARLAGLIPLKIVSIKTYFLATIFGRLFSQYPVMIPLYDFLNNEIKQKIFKIFAEKFIQNPENDLVLIFFGNITVINDNYYSDDIKRFVFIVNRRNNERIYF